ncbi:MAG: hypothetical protein IPN49_04505 [Saprospiraceae bacterium]|nr:hypothetical protein [Saprospiraceae bacterium]MBK8818371.1 hypothetical protein [Saprospiraceae bacterium]
MCSLYSPLPALGDSQAGMGMNTSLRRIEKNKLRLAVYQVTGNTLSG